MSLGLKDKCARTISYSKTCIEYYFKLPKMSLTEGGKYIKKDKDLGVMINNLPNNRVAEVYFTHSVPHSIGLELNSPSESIDTQTSENGKSQHNDSDEINETDEAAESDFVESDNEMGDDVEGETKLVPDM